MRQDDTNLSRQTYSDTFYLGHQSVLLFSHNNLITVTPPTQYMKVNGYFIWDSNLVNHVYVFNSEVHTGAIQYYTCPV